MIQPGTPLLTVCIHSTTYSRFLLTLTLAVCLESTEKSAVVAKDERWRSQRKWPLVTCLRDIWQRYLIFRTLSFRYDSLLCFSNNSLIQLGEIWRLPDKCVSFPGTLRTRFDSQSPQPLISTPKAKYFFVQDGNTWEYMSLVGIAQKGSQILNTALHVPKKVSREFGHPPTEPFCSLTRTQCP
jgi:hypothetical protein